jgi:hypothetical protein
VSEPKPSERDWLEWHGPYDVDGSPLQRRLAIVQQHIREALDRLPAGPIRIVSVCAGQGRDLLGVLPHHPRRDDVLARLVELDPRNVSIAQRAMDDASLSGVDIVRGDASTTSAYVGAVPADVVLVCGVFGNISDDDIEHTVKCLPSLCAGGASVIWTRHRRPPDLTPAIRGWFRATGFEEQRFDTAADALFAIGTHRFTGTPTPIVPRVRLFSFVGDGTLGWR